MRTATLRGFIFRFVKDESGSNALEYGLIVGLISLAIVAGAGAAGGALGTLFNTIGATIQTEAAAVSAAAKG